MTWIILPYQGIADQRVKIYGNKNVDINKVSDLLSKSPIKGNQTVHVFLVPRWLMIMVNPIIGINAQGFNYPVINFIFANQDANIDTARTLEGLVTHETTHTDINRKLGFKTIFFPTWKTEGICDYVSQESSISINDTNLVLKKYHNNANLTNKEKYLIYKTEVQTLVNQGISLNDILIKDIKEPKI